MKGCLMAAAAFFVVSAAAVAKPVPVGGGDSIDDPALTFSSTSGADINIGPVDASLEREYFQPPQTQFNAGSFSCRLRPIIFEKTRVARTCR